MRKTPRELDAPVASSQQLGRAVRALRRERGLTLTQVSEQSGLSVPFLSQVENNRAKPSLQSLAAIATALGAKMTDIMSAAQADLVVDVETAPANRGDADRPLGRLGGRVQVEELTRSAGAGEDWQTHLHGVVLYVVRGSAVVTVSEAGSQGSHVLGPGDRMVCGGGVAYRWQAGDSGAILLVVRVDDRAVLSGD
jgi:transcriptional regulator with XRE-family HTH domain